jgi:6-phosphofructokinase
VRVIGIRNGFEGLIWPEGAKEMTEDSVSGILPRGGTILGTTNRGNPFAYVATEDGDRILGTRFGVVATDLVARQQFGRMVCLKAGKMENVSLDEGLEKMKYIDPSSEIVRAARATFGDDGA